MKNKYKTEQKEPAYQRGYFTDTLIKGVLVLLPITIILILLSVIFNFIFGILTPVSSLLHPGSEEPHWIFNIISMAVLLIFVFLVGMAIKNKLSRTYFRVFEKKYLNQIPLYNAVHETVYQFAGLKKLPFSDVVLIDPFNTGTQMTGFVTDKVNEGLYTVFVPTAPNPTNGNIYHVKQTAITFLNVSSQDAMRTIVSMGTGTSKLMASHRSHKEELEDI